MNQEEGGKEKKIWTREKMHEGCKMNEKNEAQTKDKTP